MLNVEVKGTGLISTRDYFKEVHNDRYQEWLAKLPSESGKLYSNTISSTEWFPVKDALYHPLKEAADMFFGGDISTAGMEVGRYSANQGLKGVYKVFLIIAKPQTLMRAAKRIIALYYKGVSVEVTDSQKNSLVFSATQIYPGQNEMDYRIIGWCQRALELANCENVKYQIVKPIAPGMFSVKLSWD
jgi:hypothetical protein